MCCFSWAYFWKTLVPRDYSLAVIRFRTIEPWPPRRARCTWPVVYADDVKRRGGLKLALTAAGRDDRRVRFATVSIAGPGSRAQAELVTDSRGRLRYPLAAGEYRLRLEQGGEAQFLVREHGWTTVRVQLP